MFVRVFAVLTMALTSWSVAAAPTCRASSGSTLLPVVELYTSQGCSSCPPAERWLSRLDTARPAVIPLSFHVTYWDYLGWRDPLAQVAFSERQRERVRRQAGRYVYTPQIVIDGRDTRDWYQNERYLALVALSHARKPRATLELGLTPRAKHVDVEVSATMSASVAPGSASLQIALVQQGAVHSIAAGENKGVTITQDHVVRALASVPKSPEGVLRYSGRLELPPGVLPSQLAVVAFVEDSQTGATLQAVRLPFCGG